MVFWKKYIVNIKNNFTFVFSSSLKLQEDVKHNTYLI